MVLETPPTRLSDAPHRVLEKPDHDEVYLDERIAETWDREPIGIKGLQRLNNLYGRPAVLGALRQLHGFPPDELYTAFGYVVKVCKG